MLIFLLRHTESLKNRNKQFTAKNIVDDLTDIGIGQAKSVAVALREQIALKGLLLSGVYSSESKRSFQTAQIIADVFDASATQLKGVDSIGSGVVGGLSEQEACKTQPQYMRALRLFRSGVLNSYLIPSFEGKEDKRDFDRRIISAFDPFRALGANECAIIVLHRSPITAFLAYCAQESNWYPKGFLGHIQVDMGTVSIVEHTVNTSRIICVNEDPTDDWFQFMLEQIDNKN